MKKSEELDGRLCFCGSGRPYSQCCGPVIEARRPAASAEELMRSRYSAYVLNDIDYLRRTWHARTRPEGLQPDMDVCWTGLTVVACQGGQSGDRSGRVEFIARYVHAGQPGQVHEDSRFVFEQGRWFYVDGDLKAPARVGRNDSCPCGSGRKFKKCCGKSPSA